MVRQRDTGRLGVLGRLGKIGRDTGDAETASQRARAILVTIDEQRDLNFGRQRGSGQVPQFSDCAASDNGKAHRRHSSDLRTQSSRPHPLISLMPSTARTIRSRSSPLRRLNAALTICQSI